MERVDIMTSEKKAEANRRNALKSTGPRTLEGKAAVRLNALKHGLLSQEMLLPGEDEEALRELGERLRNELQPAGELENLLVDRIISAYWRLRRLGRVETGIFAWERSEELAERAEREAHRYESGRREDLEDLVKGLDITITDEKKHEEALSRARRMRSEQEDETATLGRTFARDADRANAFSKLSRYETAIERALYRALHELERRQAARGGAALTPPQVLDVDVSGMPEETGH
jgi:hypothetical protein